MAKKKVSNKPKTENELDTDFRTKYEALCKRYNRTITAEPGWRYSGDGNDYRLVMRLVVERTRGDNRDPQ